MPFKVWALCRTTCASPWRQTLFNKLHMGRCILKKQAHDLINQFAAIVHRLPRLVEVSHLQVLVGMFPLLHRLCECRLGWLPLPRQPPALSQTIQLAPQRLGIYRFGQGIHPYRDACIPRSPPAWHGQSSQ